MEHQLQESVKNQWTAQQITMQILLPNSVLHIVHQPKQLMPIMVQRNVNKNAMRIFLLIILPIPALKNVLHLLGTMDTKKNVWKVVLKDFMAITQQDNVKTHGIALEIHMEIQQQGPV